MRGCVIEHGRVGRDKVSRKGVGGGFWIFDDDGRWSILFRGRIRGLDLGRVRLVFLPFGVGGGGGVSIIFCGETKKNDLDR
jgi:hypothetical protein